MKPPVLKKLILLAIFLGAFLTNAPAHFFLRMGLPQVAERLAILEARAAAPAFQAASAIAASTGVDVTVTLPAHQADDIFLIQVMVRDLDDTITWPSGWTQIATVSRTSRWWWAWKRATSTAETDPLVDKNTTTGDTYAAVTTYRGAITTGDPWGVKGTPNTSIAAAHVLNGISTISSDSLIVASLCGADNTAATPTTFSAGDPTSLPQVLYVESTTGTDGACTAGAGAKAFTDGTGSVTATWTATVVESGGIVLALKPPTVAQTVTIGVAAGSKATTLNSGDSNQFANTLTCTASSTCAAFTLKLNADIVTLNSIKITETGTVNANADLSNFTLTYTTSTTGNFASGTVQYGTGVATSTGEAITFTNHASTSLTLTTKIHYFFPSFDLKSPIGTSTQTFPKGGQTIDFQIAASSDVSVSTGTVTGAPASLAGTTTVLPEADALTTTVGANGIVQSDPTSGSDTARALAVDSQYVYVVGNSTSTGVCVSDCWRIEKRDKTTGALVATFDGDGIVESDPTSGSDIPRAVALDSSYIYVAGYQQQASGDCDNGVCWRIEKRDKTTGALVSAFGSSGVVQISDGAGLPDYAYAIAVDSSYIYVAGPIGEFYIWRIEKRDKTTGARVTTFNNGFSYISSNPGGGPGGGNNPTAIAVDSSYIYVVGGSPTLCIPGGSVCWHIEKYDKTSGALVTAFDGDGVALSNPTGGSDFANAIATDSSYIYVAGSQATGGVCSTGSDCWRIEKRNKTSGALVTAFDGDGVALSDPTSGSDIANAIAVDSSYVYISGYQNTTSTGGCATGSNCWRIEKRDKTTGALVTAFDGDGVAQSDPTSGSDPALALAIDSTYLYAAGYQATGAGCATGSDCWRIEKRRLDNGTLTATFGGAVNAGDQVTIGGYGFGAPIAGADRQSCVVATVDKGCVKFVLGPTSIVANSTISTWTNTNITFTTNSILSSSSGVNSVEVRAANQADATRLTLTVSGGGPVQPPYPAGVFQLKNNKALIKAGKFQIKR